MLLIIGVMSILTFLFVLWDTEEIALAIYSGIASGVVGGVFIYLILPPLIGPLHGLGVPIFLAFLIAMVVSSDLFTKNLGSSKYTLSGILLFVVVILLLGFLSSEPMLSEDMHKMVGLLDDIKAQLAGKPVSQRKS